MDNYECEFCGLKGMGTCNCPKSIEQRKQEEEK
jgi:hypothetical protein